MQNIPFLRIEKQHDYNCFPFIFHSGHVLPLGGQNGKNINWAIWIGRISDQVDSAWSTRATTVGREREGFYENFDLIMSLV